MGINFSNVVFLRSGSRERDFPTDGRLEVAFVGRSNVGKSSLLNMLTGRRNIARVSKTPGRTQLVNFFEIDNLFYFVDLPGYGFAHVPDSVRMSWRRLMESYLSNRDALGGLVLLLDIRRDPSVEDHQMYEWLRVFDVPILPVLTKGDKLSRQACMRRSRVIGEQLSLSAEHFIVSSTLKGWGCEEIRDAIEFLVSERSEV